MGKRLNEAPWVKAQGFIKRNTQAAPLFIHILKDADFWPRMYKIYILFFFLSIFSMASLSPAYASQDPRKDLSLHYYRGVVNFQAGRYENALGEFQAVVALDPYFKDTQKYIENCMKILEKGRQDLYNPKDPSASQKKDFDLYFLGKAYFEKSEFERALKVFKTVLAKNPNDKFAKYYIGLCESNLYGAKGAKKERVSPQEEQAAGIVDLEREVSYVKSDIKEQQRKENLFESKAERKAAREELIAKKEEQLKEQEELLEEERQDYLAEARLSKREEKIRRETEKWKNLKERVTLEAPGVPADFAAYPVYVNRADGYYTAMKEALRSSRWNSAGLNAINASITYCDALLIYFYGIKSTEPAHENICRLLLLNVKRADLEENVFHLRSILKVKKLVETEDRPIIRSEAIFLAQHAEKLAEWFRSISP